MTYPINLQLKGRRAVVVGGGAVGLRKLKRLAEAGASVRLIAPTLPPDVELPHGVEWRAIPYAEGALQGALLVFAATNDAQVNQQVIADAKEQGALVCSVDAPEQGDFTLPAVLQRGPLTISIATDGNSPALAALLRDRLAAEVGNEWAHLTRLAGELRRQLIAKTGSASCSRLLLNRAVDEGILSTLALGDIKGARAQIKALLAKEATQKR